MSNATTNALRSRWRRAIDVLAWAVGAGHQWAVDRGWWPGRRLVAVGGQGALWRIQGRVGRPLPRSARPRGLVVPEQEALAGQLSLPPLPRAALDAAVREALWAHAPLPLDQMAWGWQYVPGPTGWVVDWVLVPQSVVERQREQAGLSASAPAFVVRGAGSRAMPLRDGAWRRWTRWQRLADTAGGLLVVTAAVALAVPMLMPAALQRQGVVLAMQRLQVLQPQAEPVRQQLDALRQQAQVLGTLREAQRAAVPLSTIVETLSAELPDDTMLDRLDASGLDVRISGLTPNATALLAKLAQHPLWADVRSANAAVRDPNTGKERFTFELRRKAADPEGQP